MNSKKKFLLLSLLTPLIVPLLILNIPDKITNVIALIPLLNLLIPFIFIVLASSLILAGIPYTLLIILVAIWSRRKSAEQLYNEIKFMPLYLLPLEFFFASMLDNRNHSFYITVTAFIDTLSTAILIAPFTILVGYTYIGIIFCLYGRLIKKGILSG